MIAIAIISAIVALASMPAFAGEFLLFPGPAKDLSAETMPYSQTLQTVVADDTFYIRGRFGVDFHAVGYRFGESGEIGVDTQNDQRGKKGKDILLGINATANITMRPTSNARFPVDNFYALLALHLSGTVSEKLSWRLYPLHHVSAHIADGHKKDTVISLPKDTVASLTGQDDTARIRVGLGVQSVSAEMVRGEVYYKPFGELAEFGAGFGYYYHVVAQKNLVFRADISLLLSPPSPCRVFGGALSPYALIRVENVIQAGSNFGAEVSAGALLSKAGRGFGVSVIYFNRLHSGYYFEKYEKGAGAEYVFLF
jgi:hypothetical protein